MVDMMIFLVNMGHDVETVKRMTLGELQSAVGEYLQGER